MLSTGLAHLVAHEAYPGHHTEHTRKEVGLVRRRQWWEESIFLVGTPQCLLAEGLADLGLEVVMGRRPEAEVAGHLRPLGIRYDAEVVAAVSEAGEALGAVRQNAAFRLHEDGADPDTVIDEVARWGLLSPDRAAKAVEFLTHPTWRAYLTCYVEGLPAVPGLRGRRPGPLRPPALRAAHPGRAGRPDPSRRHCPPRSRTAPVAEGRRRRPCRRTAALGDAVPTTGGCRARGPTPRRGVKVTDMKALQVTAHGRPGEVLAVRTVARPEPGPGEVRVRVGAASLNFNDIDRCRGQPGVGAHASAVHPGDGCLRGGRRRG